jgi:hypothetical protein
LGVSLPLRSFESYAWGMLSVGTQLAKTRRSPVSDSDGWVRLSDIDEKRGPCEASVPSAVRT